jgi:hypothetical protein
MDQAPAIVTIMRTLKPGTDWPTGCDALDDARLREAPAHFGMTSVPLWIKKWKALQITGGASV